MGPQRDARRTTRPSATGATNGRPAPTAHADGVAAELDGLHATCRRQAHVIDTLTEAVSALRSGASALKAENADLRAARDRGAAGARASRAADARNALEVRLPLDVRAPARARMLVAECLWGRVAGSLLERAQLVVSELVSNSVCHSGASAGAVVVVRVQRTGTLVRVEVQDPGHAGAIAPPSADLERGRGFGLNLVQALSERWGLERVAAGGTRVWAQLALSAPVPPEPSLAAGTRSSENATPIRGRAPVMRQAGTPGGAS